MCLEFVCCGVSGGAAFGVEVASAGVVVVSVRSRRKCRKPLPNPPTCCLLPEPRAPIFVTCTASEMLALSLRNSCTAGRYQGDLVALPLMIGVLTGFRTGASHVMGLGPIGVHQVPGNRPPQRFNGFAQATHG
jgi:hypothetical protein